MLSASVFKKPCSFSFNRTTCPDTCLRSYRDNRIETQQDQAKWEYLKEWIQAVNEYGGFGKWDWRVAAEPNVIVELL